MATQVQFRRGTTAEHSSFKGAEGEVTVDTSLKTVVIHDAITNGGFPVLRDDGSNSQLLRGSVSSCSLKFANDPNTGLIADGRDMGSVVFPEAKIKIYLDASIEERAKRRQIQLKEKGMEVNMRNLIISLEERDLKDKNREVSPLLIPNGAKVIDSTNLSIDEVVNKIMDLI